MGTWRLFLAALVVASHAGFVPYGLGLGICAVIGFFMVSGYAMSGMMEVHFPPDRHGTLAFYRDRALRLLPQYYAWALLTVPIILLGPPRGGFQAGPADWVNVVGNITVFPLNFYMYVPSLAHVMILPPAWSLATELQFYAVFPLLRRYDAAAWIAAGIGLAVFVLATNNLIDAEAFSFRLLPGVLPFFMLGRAAYRRDRAMLVFITAILLADFAWLAASGQAGRGYNADFMLGTVMGLFGVLVVPRLRPASWDRAAGNASYGTYLGQTPVLMLIDPFVPDLPRQVAISVVASVLGGWAAYRLVEQPIARARRRLRPDAPRAGAVDVLHGAHAKVGFTASAEPDVLIPVSVRNDRGGNA
jgi:peptidoglycan/LPS O-acetylase OafA/YrhL